MGKHILKDGQITAFGKYLHGEERSAGTITNHLRHARAFSVWLNGRAVTRAAVVEWKEKLVSCGYAPASVNAMLAAVHSLFQFLGWNDCRVKYLTVQKRLFRDRDRELTRDDYRRLLETAVSTGRERLALVLETMYATGIRVSELCYITVEALRCGQAENSLKGKIRVILLPAKLCRKLLKYAKRQKIASGEVFLTKSGKSLGRRQVWADMKRLCRECGVAASKVFPHNLRRLFAATYYRRYRDVVQLSCILGHSSIETTRIYLLTSASEFARKLDRLQLVS